MKQGAFELGKVGNWVTAEGATRGHHRQNTAGAVEANSAFV